MKIKLNKHYYEVDKYDEEQNLYGLVVPTSRKKFEKFISNLFSEIPEPTSKQFQNYKLIKRYPFLLPVNGYSGYFQIYTNKLHNIFSYTHFDDLPKGWRLRFGAELVKELAEELRKYPGLIYKYRILQIKEKWGTLRWYDGGNTKKGYKIIDKYSNLTQLVCIYTGKDADCVTHGYIEYVSKDFADNNHYNYKLIPETKHTAWEEKYGKKPTLKSEWASYQF